MGAEARVVIVQILQKVPYVASFGGGSCESCVADHRFFQCFILKYVYNQANALMENAGVMISVMESNVVIMVVVESVRSLTLTAASKSRARKQTLTTSATVSIGPFQRSPWRVSFST